MNNRNKRTVFRRTLKITAWSLGGVVAALLVLIAIAVNFVFTPARLTPVVLKVANEALDARLEMKSVELTFFSTFPRFGLRLTDGALVSKAFRDTLWTKSDSLLTFGKCVVVVSPFDYLTQEKLTLNYLSIEDASVYAFRENGKANWEVVRDSAEVAEEDTVSSASPGLAGGLDLRRIVLKHTQVVFDDRDTKVYARLEDANLKLSASLGKEHSQLQLDFDNRNILFWQEGQLLVNRLAAEVNTDLELDRATRTLSLHDARVALNGVAFDVKGALTRDTLRQCVAVSLDYGLHAPSLETVLHFIPESVLKREAFQAKGEVKMSGEIRGDYGKDLMPELTVHIQANKVSGKYEGLPYGIDEFSADFSGYVDLMRCKPSFADLKIFHFQGAHTDILADARIDDLLGDPDITFNTRSTVDLTALTQTFPLQEGVTIEGKMAADLKLRARLSSLKRQDIGRIWVQGNLDMQGMALRDMNKNFEFLSDASFHFSGDDRLEAEAEIRKLNLRSRMGDAALALFSAQVQTTNPQDTTRIAEVACKLSLNRLNAAQGDSLGLFCGQAKASVQLKPSEQDPLSPQVVLTMDVDTLFARAAGVRAGMDKAGFAVTAVRKDSMWVPKGIIGFHHLVAHTPQLSLPVQMEKTSLTVGNRQIKLRNATCRIGRSDLTATGAVYDLYGAMKYQKPLCAKLEITSERLNCNQLIRALNFPQDTLQVSSEAVEDTSAMELFVIPANWDFELHTQLKKVKYGKMKLENVQGAVDIRNQAVHLKGLSMKSMGADMTATVVYRAREKSKGYAGFDFKLKHVDIAHLVDVTPSLDTIVPMLRSFQGVVNFEVAAESELDSCMNIQIPSLRSAMHIKGDSLVLMDGETFAEISKMLRFKNKKRNLIDSIAVNVTVQDGNVTVYPFLLQMDRYKAAIGGKQGLDMNFDYHISILKSPIPFKMGINIRGNLDKMKIRLGKAKYKNAVTPVEIHRVDSARMNLGSQIVHDFHKVMREVENREIPTTE